jgi:hypothetical protein
MTSVLTITHFCLLRSTSSSYTLARHPQYLKNDPGPPLRHQAILLTPYDTAKLATTVNASGLSLCCVGLTSCLQYSVLYFSPFWRPPSSYRLWIFVTYIFVRSTRIHAVC